MTERNADVSKTLTKKWKKGELPDGFYWCDVDIYEDGNITKQIESFIHHHPVFYWETSIVRVIELAPSFSEYKSMQEENTKLKELLKRVNEHFKWVDFDDNNYVNYELWGDIKKVLGEE